MAHPQQSADILNEYSLALSLYVQPPPTNDSPPIQLASRQPSDVPPRPTLVPHQLTARQLTVLRYLCQGYTNRQTAQRMGFSESTVRQETMAIYAYLGVRGRAEAVRAALDSGVVTDTSGGEVKER
jgi:DNA-binding CsgD family transcriptional regulator